VVWAHHAESVCEFFVADAASVDSDAGSVRYTRERDGYIGDMRLVDCQLSIFGSLRVAEAESVREAPAVASKTLSQPPQPNATTTQPANHKLTGR
jgi:hypothetical protein